MVLKKKQIELLAPAKDLECGVAAINCGADAVYIGAARFGAREKAGNPLEEIAALAEHAHKYWARVYVVVNTLLKDDELSSAERLIRSLYDIGVDGLIVQDAGLFELDLPPLPLFASTQMHNQSVEKVAFLEKVGFKRAILARELDLKQIKDIRKKTSIELECFVHGALCVSYSGQCYLSYALGGRSGNRGRCAQPCRKVYALHDADGAPVAGPGHLLSLKDLNLSERLYDLIQAGVSSFKIEGRLKDKAYVANVVAYYRKKLDDVLKSMGLEKSSSGEPLLDFEPDLSKTFNRGYTNYFLDGRSGKIGSIKTPKMTGEYVGRVAGVSKNTVAFNKKNDLRPGDGICFFDDEDRLMGSTVNVVHGKSVSLETPRGIKKGSVVYRNRDHAFLSTVGGAKTVRLIPVRFFFSETTAGVRLIVMDEDGVQVEVEHKGEFEPADKPDKAMDVIRRQLEKTGGGLFSCASVEIELRRPLFIPMSILNAMRRDALDALAGERIERRPIHRCEINTNTEPFPITELDYTGNVLNKCAETFYRRHGVERIEPAAESGLDLAGRKVMTTRYCLKHQLDLCPKMKAAKQLKEPLYLIDEQGRRLQLDFRCDRCEMDVILTS